MTKTVEIVGVAACTSRLFGDPLEFVVRDMVLGALSAANTSLDSVDMVVTVASDIMDGVMVATRSEIAGACGRGFMNVPSSAGHALAAAITLIESGQAETVLLVGWGEGSKLRQHDYRGILADPFYDRPVGGEPAAMSRLQAQRLKADGHLTEAYMAQYLDVMAERAQHPATGESDPLAWLAPQWCDGAAALVLRASAPQEGRGVFIRDFGVAFRSYCPMGDDLDPALWVRDAFEHRRDRQALPVPVLIEASAPAAFCEARAVRGFLAGQEWHVAEAQINRSGGGAAAHFGPATGLHGLARASGFLADFQPADSEAGDDPRCGLVIDLAGPIGQAVTVAMLETRGGAL